MCLANVRSVLLLPLMETCWRIIGLVSLQNSPIIMPPSAIPKKQSTAGARALTISKYKYILPLENDILILHFWTLIQLLVLFTSAKNMTLVKFSATHYNKSWAVYLQNAPRVAFIHVSSKIWLYFLFEKCCNLFWKKIFGIFFLKG